MSRLSKQIISSTLFIGCAISNCFAAEDIVIQLSNSNENNGSVIIIGRRPSIAPAPLAINVQEDEINGSYENHNYLENNGYDENNDCNENNESQNNDCSHVNLIERKKSIPTSPSSSIRIQEGQSTLLNSYSFGRKPSIPTPSSYSTTPENRSNISKSMFGRKTSVPTPSSYAKSLKSDTNANKKVVRILSIDGGGVKGITTASFLKELEKKTGKSVSEMFHLVGGTSAGGIITTALTLPIVEGSNQPKYSASDIVKVLKDRSKNMFKKRWWSFWGLYGHTYDPISLETTLKEFIGEGKFQNTTIPAMVVSYDISELEPKIFKSWRTDETFSRIDVAMATSAAETYFPPRLVRPLNENTTKSYTLVDGGACANNPTLLLLAEAKRLYKDADSFEIVSLGTGNSVRPLHFEKMKDAGLLKWAQVLINIFMNGQSTKDDYILKSLFNQKPSIFAGNYTRWNPVLDSENVDLDNVSPYNLHELIVASDHMIKSHEKLFNKLVERLKEDKYEFNNPQENNGL